MPSYDIDNLIRVHSKPAKVLFSLWEVLSQYPYADLSPEERIILDGWNFDSAMGNGIVDLITNESYDTIAKGLNAVRQLGDPDLDEFSRKIEGVFDRHGIRSNSDDEIAKLECLTDSERSDMEEALARAELPFRDRIWKDEIIINGLWKLIERSLPKLRDRK